MIVLEAASLSLVRPWRWWSMSMRPVGLAEISE